MRTLSAVEKSSWLVVMGPEVELRESAFLVVMAAAEAMPVPAVRVMAWLSLAVPMGAFWEMKPEAE